MALSIIDEHYTPGRKDFTRTCTDNRILGKFQARLIQVPVFQWFAYAFDGAF